MTKAIWTLLFFSLPVLAGFPLTNSDPALDDVYQSEVWYGSNGQTSDGSSAIGYCNGTLVSPSLIVTAAHCVSQAWVLKSFEIQLEVGKYIYVTKPSGQVIRVGYQAYFNATVAADFLFGQEAAQKILSDGLSAELKPEIDQGVIRLRTPLTLPADFPFRKLVAQAQALQFSQQVLESSPEVCSVNPIAFISTTDTKRIASLNNLTYHNEGYFKSRSTSTLEEGDSGSGLLVKVGNEYQLLAVAKGEEKVFLMTSDVYNLVAGPVCAIAQSAGASVGLSADEQSILCR